MGDVLHGPRSCGSTAHTQTAGGAEKQAPRDQRNDTDDNRVRTARGAAPPYRPHSRPRLPRHWRSRGNQDCKVWSASSRTTIVLSSVFERPGVVPAELD